MAVDERSRHELYLWLEQAAGPERAATLMSLLPPVGWADVATTHDLEVLRIHMDQRFEHMDQRVESVFVHIDQRFEIVENRVLATMRGENVQQTRTLLLAAVPMMIALVSLTFTAVRLG